MKFALTLGLLGLLPTSTLGGTCTATIQTRSIDVMSDLTEHQNGKETTTKKIDRYDFVVFTIDAGEKVYYSDNHGPDVSMDQCTYKGKNYECWGEKNGEWGETGNPGCPTNEWPRRRLSSGIMPGLTSAGRRLQNTEGDEEGEDENENEIPKCITESPCFSMPQEVSCDWIIAFMGCKTPVCEDDEIGLAFLNAGFEEICNGKDEDGGDPNNPDDQGCGRGDDQEPCTVYDAVTWMNPDNYPDLYAGKRLTLPAYPEDPIGKFFRYQEPREDDYWTAPPIYDRFSAFTDFDFKFDDATGRCQPYVKTSNKDNNENFRKLVSIDGVNAACIMDAQWAHGPKNHVCTDCLGCNGESKSWEDEDCTLQAEDECYAPCLEHWSDERGRFGAGESETPMGWIQNMRKSIRRATGAAPPTEFDGEETIRIVTMDEDDEGNPREKIEDKLMTYGNFLNTEGKRQKRMEKLWNSRDQCGQPPIRMSADGLTQTYPPPGVAEEDAFEMHYGSVKRTTVTIPDSCARDDGPRVEKKSAAAESAPCKFNQDGSIVDPTSCINPNVFVQARIVRKADLVGSEGTQKSLFIDNLATMDHCNINLHGIVNADGEPLCEEFSWSGGKPEPVAVSEPFCSFTNLMDITAEMRKTLETMADGEVAPKSSVFLPYLGTDSWGQCAMLVDQALTFIDKEKEIFTSQCQWREWEADEKEKWEADACCNYRLMDTMCCVPTEKTVAVPEASVDTSKLAQYCASDVGQLTAAIFSAKAFVENRKASIDPTSGCLGTRTEKLAELEALADVGSDCANEVMGQENTHNQFGQLTSSKSCVVDQQCYSGKCKDAEEGSTTRVCQTSNKPEHVAKCIQSKMWKFPKAKAIFKDLFANGNAKATDFQLGQGLADVAGWERCTGPGGWNFDPNWRNCKTYNEDTFECDEYYCDDYEDCKSQCINGDQACNSHPWDENYSEASCTASRGSMGTKFCAMCWGDSDCNEVSRPSQCRLREANWEAGTGNDSRGRFDDAGCALLLAGGSDQTEADWQAHWDRKPSMCVNSASTAEDCYHTQVECDAAGFKDIYSCQAPMPVDQDCSVFNTEYEREYDWGTNTEINWHHHHWYMAIPDDHDSWTSVCSSEIRGESATEIESMCSLGTEPAIKRTAAVACRETEMCYNSVMTQQDCEIMGRNAQNFVGDISKIEGVDYFSDEKRNSLDGANGAATDRDCLTSGCANIHWDTDLDVCKIWVSRDDEHNTMSEWTAMWKDCNDFTFTGMVGTWKAHVPREFRKGEFDNEELCNAGVCDLDWNLDADECAATEKCTRNNCWGCERDWSNPEAHTAPHEVCYSTSNSQAECLEGTWTDSDGNEQTSDAPGRWEAVDDGTSGEFACFFKDPNHFGGPSNCDFEYASCENMEATQCGGGAGDLWGDYKDNIIKDKLFCAPSSWRECKTEESCESAGECNGGLRKHYCYQNDKQEHVCSVRRNVCVAPKVANEWGHLQCEEYGNWDDGVEWTETACVLVKKESREECDAVEGAVWTSTDVDEEACMATKKCSSNGGMWFNNFDEDECVKCEDDWVSTNSWSGGSWKNGEVKSIYEWKERVWGGKNAWVSELDRWRINYDVMDSVIGQLQLEVESGFIQCMYGGMIDSIEKVACVCGKDSEECNQDKVLGASVELVKTKAYQNAAETAGREMATKLKIARDSVNGTSNVLITSDMFFPKTSEDVGSTDFVAEDKEDMLDGQRMLRRRLEGAEATLNSPECSTVVTNDGGFLVGQMVGDCVTLNVSTPLAVPTELCIATKDSISINPNFDVAGVASKTKGEAGEDIYEVYSVATLSKGLHCVMVQDSIRLCPIWYGNTYETATTDLGSGQCKLVDIIVQEIALKQACTRGDSKSCKWLESGSLSAAVAMGAGVIAFIAICACIVMSCGGAWAHPKSRGVMLKHLNKQFYNEADLDGDGMLDRGEVKTMLKNEFGEDAGEVMLDEIFNKYDADGNGQLDFAEYKEFISHHTNSATGVKPAGVQLVAISNTHL